MLHMQHQRPVSPPWKIRTRPCPFYSSGRCLFSTSCNFRHIIKSPLTPIDRTSFYIPEAPKNESPELQGNDVLDPQQKYVRESSQDVSVLSDFSTHTRNYSTSSHALTVSSTETGTVRGYTNKDDSRYKIFVNETESPVLGLGLTNLYEAPRPSTPVELPGMVPDATIESTDKPSRSSINTRSRDKLSDFVFPKESNTRREVPPSGRPDATSVQSSQELEIHSPVTSNVISLATPNASSLIMNRTRKGTIMHTPQVEEELDVPQVDFESSPTVTLKNILRPEKQNLENLDTGKHAANKRHVERKDVEHKDVELQDADKPTHEEPQPPSSSLLETPPIDYENDTPSQARLRFQRAYLLVTKELRQRVAHLRKSPITPDHPERSQTSEAPSISPDHSGPSFVASGQDNFLSELNKKIESPAFIDQYYASPEADDLGGSGSASPIQDAANSRRSSSRSVESYYGLPKNHDRFTSLNPGEALSDSQNESPISDYNSSKDQDHSRFGLLNTTTDISSPQADSPTSIEHYYTSPKNPVYGRSESMNSVVEAVNSRKERPMSIELQPESRNHSPSGFVNPTEEATSSRPWLKPFRLSTFGMQPSPITPDRSNFSFDQNKRISRSIPASSRSGSPVKRASSSLSSGKLKSGKSFEIFRSQRSIPASPFTVGLSSPQIPFATPWNSLIQRGSTPHIHSPSPSRWTPATNHPDSTISIRSLHSRNASPVQTTKEHISSPSKTRQKPLTRPNSVLRSHSADTPPQTGQPKLFFAIASNQPEQVSKLLANGDASPNETVGPQDMHALAFAVDNMNHGNPADLPKMEEIVTTLLSYGADPNAIGKKASGVTEEQKQGVNPLIDYFLEKAQRSPVLNPTGRLLQESEIPLKRAKFAIVGQEIGIDELSRAHAAHSRLARYLSEEDEMETAFVAVFTGPSGHGKTLLASKIGGILGVPTYTINMTLIKGQADLWSAKSCNPREASEKSTLKEFLLSYSGQKVVVVIDEIEKAHDPAVLQCLLMPWETGRLLDSDSSESIDTSKVVWICTSNTGSQQILKSMQSVCQVDVAAFKTISTEARSYLRDSLGSSLVARVSIIIPFLPFSYKECLAISSKCLTALKRNISMTTNAPLPEHDWDALVKRAADDYIEAEGARSIRRSILHLMDSILHGD
ncbi:hypothetical protein CPB86DRAFT_541392 [Serendipita vermifera]|nr:hypothetical protein CPB86DRAFT_541392 [Serendipita vermifera]